MKTLLPLALLIASLALAAPAGADEEARTVELPDVGLSVGVPAGWTLDQYGPAALSLEKDGARVWFYLREDERKDIEAPLRRMAERVAADQPDGKTPEIRPCPAKGTTGAAALTYREGDETRLFVVVAREGDGGFDIEALTPKGASDGLANEVVEIATNVDVTRYVEADRLVDWTLGFTLDGVALWKQERAGDGGVRLIAPGEPQAALRIVPASRSSTQPVARLDRVLQDSYGRLRKAGFTVTPKADADGATFESIDFKRDEGAPLKGVRTVVSLEKPGVEAELTIEAVTEDDLVVVWLGGTEPALERGRARARTFRAGTHPGPRVDAQAETIDRIPTDRGPALRFSMPDDWTLDAGHGMRLAVFGPDTDLEGVVYWFEGRGGSLEANLERWKGQWGHAEPKVATHEGEGVKTTVLQFTGKSSGMGPHGGGGDAEKIGLLAYVEIEGGPLTIKLVGPTDQMTDAVLSAFDDWVASFHLGD